MCTFGNQIAGKEIPLYRTSLDICRPWTMYLFRCFCVYTAFCSYLSLLRIFDSFSHIFERSLRRVITRPEESYRLWCIVGCDIENLMNEETLAQWGLSRQKQTNKHTNKPCFRTVGTLNPYEDCRIFRCKGKDKFSLFTRWRLREWTYSPTFSSLRQLILVRCQGYAPNVLPPGERSLCPLIGRLGRPRADLDILEKGKTSYPCQNSNRGSYSPRYLCL